MSLFSFPNIVFKYIYSRLLCNQKCALVDVDIKISLFQSVKWDDIADRDIHTKTLHAYTFACGIKTVQLYKHSQRHQSRYRYLYCKKMSGANTICLLPQFIIGIRISTKQATQLRTEHLICGDNRKTPNQKRCKSVRRIYESNNQPCEIRVHTHTHTNTTDLELKHTQNSLNGYTQYFDDIASPIYINSQYSSI